MCERVHLINAKKFECNSIVLLSIQQATVQTTVMYFSPDNNDLLQKNLSLKNQKTVQAIVINMVSHKGN